MRSIVRQTALVVLLLVTALTLSGCDAKQPRKAKQKFQVISIDSVSGSIENGWKIDLTMENNTIHNLVLTKGWVILHHNNRKVAYIRLDSEVKIPRRSRSKISVPVRATLSLAMMPLLAKVRNGDYSEITIDYSLSARMMSREAKIENYGVPLETLAQQFNSGIKR